MNKTYASLHTHTTYSLLDSTSTPEQMIDRAVEVGLSAIAITEHGNVYSWIKKKQYCDKKGIKYIHGCEFYLTETLEEKIRDNYHVILLAKNWNGVLEINELFTKSTQPDHMYYRNRISFDEFLATSDNIITISACLGSVLNKLPRDHKRYQELLNHFDYLEVHNHQVDEQKSFNEYLATLGKPLVAAGDFHEVSDYKFECRLKWKAGKGTGYEGEDAFDLVLRGYDEFRQAFINQGSLSVSQIDEAISNTNVIADMVEDFELDLTFKFPDLYDDAVGMIQEQTAINLNKFVESGVIPEDKLDAYIERIETELHAFNVLGMESFILFMSEVMTFCVNEGIGVGPARGSASGSLVCYLLNVTDVDPMVWDTNFTRFINVNRISLPDIDTDFAPLDRPRVFEYIQNRFGMTQSSYIATFQKLGVKKVIEDISRAINKPINEMAEIKKGYEVIEIKESKLKRKFENGGMDEDEYKTEMDIIEKEMEEYLAKFEDIFYYYEGLKGAINATGYHPAGMIGSPIDITGTIGLRYNSGNGGWVSSCDMKAVDGLNYVKYDILSLKTMQVIKHAYELLGTKIPRSHEIDWNDQAVFEAMEMSPIGLFQFEADSAHHYLSKFQCKSVRDIAFVTAVIRPSCASFRETAIDRVANINPDSRIDEVLKDSIGYLVYQEQQIAFLQKLCGFTEGEADVVRRAIGKKDPVLLAQWLPKIEAGYIANSPKDEETSKKEFAQFLQVFMDAVNYSFSYNHAIAYSMITYMTAYLRHYHPVEFITAYLNNATDEDDIKAGTELAKYCGVEVKNPKFGSSRGAYSIDGKDIYKGIKSILYVSDNCAEALLNVHREASDFQSAVRLALASQSVNMRQLKVLIKCDFFSQYGKARKLYEWLLRYEAYGNRKQLSKEGLPSGTKALVERCLNNQVAGFSESDKQYKINAEVIMDMMFKAMKDIDFTPEERVVNQLSYMGYIQDEDLMGFGVGTVATNKTKLDAYKVDFINGTSAWMKFADNVEQPSKGDMIMIHQEGLAKRGRYTDRVVMAYAKLQLDRQTQSNKKEGK